MTKPSSKDKDQELQKALAILISNTRSSKRPLPLTEVAKWLNVAVKQLGSFPAVADRVGLSTKMLRQFSYVNRLSRTAQRLVERRKLDSVDAVTHLAMLPQRVQEAVSSALEAGEIDTVDIRTFVQLHRAGHPGSTEGLFKKVKEAKTKREFIAEFVVRGSGNRSRIMKALRKFISPDAILRLELTGTLGRLVLSQKGKKELFQAARELGVSINQVIPTILEG